MTIGDRIKKQRKLLRLSQTELAKNVKVSKQTLYKYENNIITNIPGDKIKDIAKYLCVSPSYLMGWEDNLLIIDYYNMLNDIGQKEAIQRIKELTYIPQYALKNTFTGKVENMEISDENLPSPIPYFTNALEAKEFLINHNIAAFSGISSDEEIIKKTNLIAKEILNTGGSHEK